MYRKKKYTSPECATYEMETILPLALSEPLPGGGGGEGGDGDEDYDGPLGFAAPTSCRPADNCRC